MPPQATVVALPTIESWAAEGRQLGDRERSNRSLMWDIGDWWNSGERYGERAQIVTAGDWDGPKHSTCRQAGPVAEKWDAHWRQSTLDFEHFRIVGSHNAAKSLLRWCMETEPPRTTRQLQAHIKQLRRSKREADLAETTEYASEQLGRQLYGVIYADPPWRFKPYAEETGSDRAADNHYPTMTVDDIADIEPPAAPNCVLFMWVTVPMLELGIDLLHRWGFEYKSACAWVKPQMGTGFWFRNQLELLLVATRGNVPAPAMGTQPPQVLTIDRGEHSAKPDAFAEMIAAMFPTVPKLEMFARRPREGWDVFGNEL